MTNRTASTDRRAFLKRGAIGAVGAAAAAVVVGGAAKTVVPAATGARTIHFTGRAWHTDTAGKVPGNGQRYSIYGELLDARGEKAGEFYSMAVGIDSPFQVTGVGVGSMEFHTLNLVDGTIVGIGAGGGTERTFAIVGGTGKYAGARGSYLARQDTYGLGGNGKAELLLTLLD